MIQALTLHGRAVPAEVIRAQGRRATATLAWGYRTVGTLVGWVISRKDDPLDGTREWRLAATLVGDVDPYFLRQRPLLLTVPRPGGFWVWPVRVLAHNGTSVSATLDPPEV